MYFSRLQRVVLPSCDAFAFICVQVLRLNLFLPRCLGVHYASFSRRVDLDCTQLNGWRGRHIFWFWKMQHSRQDPGSLLSNLDDGTAAATVSLVLDSKVPSIIASSSSPAAATVEDPASPHVRCGFRPALAPGGSPLSSPPVLVVEPVASASCSSSAPWHP